jgi:hypothetical protein
MVENAVCVHRSVSFDASEAADGVANPNVERMCGFDRYADGVCANRRIDPPQLDESRLVSPEAGSYERPKGRSECLIGVSVAVTATRSSAKDGQQRGSSGVVMPTPEQHVSDAPRQRKSRQESHTDDDRRPMQRSRPDWTVRRSSVGLSDCVDRPFDRVEKPRLAARWHWRRSLRHRSCPVQRAAAGRPADAAHRFRACADWDDPVSPLTRQRFSAYGRDPASVRRRTGLPPVIRNAILQEWESR